MGKSEYLIALSVFAVIWLIVFLFSRRKIPKLFSVLLGLSPLILIYALNPNIRIFSNHGFRHAGIVYQLLQGNIPPRNPLMAGEILQHPWGWHCVGALITKVFGVSPFYSFAVMNILSLCLVMILVYQISHLVIEDENANIFSVLVSVFALTVYTHISTETRGVPLFEKFANSNGVPVGLVFFLLSLRALIKLFQNRNLRGNLLLFFFSFLGGGFLYPAFLPGIVAGTVLLCLVTVLFPGWRREGGRDLKKIIPLTGAVVLGIICLSPYVLSITAGLRGQAELFNLHGMSIKIVRYLVVTLPLLVILFFNRGFFLDHTDRTAATALLIVVIATFLCYLLISLPLETEVKFFLLSTLTLGIGGGIAFHAMNQRLYKTVVFIIVLLFLVPLFLRIKEKLFFHRDYLPVFSLYGERGRYLFSAKGEENELYQWIRHNTGKESVFIDLKLDIPVLAQRQLFIGVDRGAPLLRTPVVKGVKNIYSGEPGYGTTIDSFLRDINCYGADLIDRRHAFVKRIYSPKGLITDAEIEELQSTFNDIYVVDRTQALAPDLNRERFNQVFRSAQGQFLVYQLNSRGAPEGLPRHRKDFKASGGERLQNTPSPPGYENRLLEAEYADAMLLPLEIAFDKDASQGRYVYAPNGTGNYYQPGRIMALYSVYSAEPGEYVLWGRTRALNGSDDSFFVQMDSGADNLWKIETADTWSWSQVSNKKSEGPVKFFLKEGLHTIKIKVREDGAKLDTLLLTNSVNFVPGQRGKQEKTEPRVFSR